MTNERNDIRVPVLTGENYTAWKFMVKSLLESTGLDVYVYGDSTLELKEDKKKRAKAILVSALDEKHVMKIVHCDSAKEIWTSLESIYEVKSPRAVNILLKQLMQTKIESIQDLDQGIGNIQSIVAKIRALGEEVTETFVVTTIECALPAAFDPFLISWELQDEKPTLNKLITKLNSFAIKLKDQDEMALAANIGNRKQNGKICRYCQKEGHLIEECRKLQWKRQEQARHQEPRKHNGYQTKNYPNQGYNQNQRGQVLAHQQQGTSNTPRGQYAQACLHEDEPQEEEEQFLCVALNDTRSANTHMALPTQAQTIDTKWIADSGCSLHMTPNGTWLHEYKKLATMIPIRLGDNREITAIGYGQLSTTSGKIAKVYHVPELRMNLFSITAAADANISALCDKNSITLMKSNKQVLKGIRKQGTYFINLQIIIDPTNICARATIDEWHARLGHISKETIDLMKKNNSVIGLEITEQLKEVCDDCEINKCTKSSHPLKTSPKATKPGMNLHFDTMGPYNPTSVGGAKFILIGKDEYTGYRFIQCMQNKSQIPETVKGIITKTEIDTGDKPLTITTDNGSEFLSERLTNFMKQHGINHKLSAPYEPQQNGFIEREVRIIKEASRTLLNKAKLPTELWAEAATTAGYILNRTINKQTNITPYEGWFSCKPNIKNLRIFGQHAAVLKNTKTQFGPKAEKLIFTGYTDNFHTYRFYNPKNNKITISSNARFLKEIGPISVEVEENPGIISVPIPGNNTVEENHVYEELPFFSPNQTIESPPRIETPDLGPDVSTTDEQMTYSNIGSPPQLEAAEDVEPIYGNLKENLNTTTTEAPISKPNKFLNYKNLVIGKITGEKALVTMGEETEPNNFNEIFHRSDRDLWLKAIDEELESLNKNNVYTLTPRPNSNIVTSKWIFKIKKKPNGEVDRYKARLVARGFTQREGIDFQDTFAPVTNITSIRLLMAYTVMEGLYTKQFDVKTAFLYGDLEEEVYLEPPQGFSAENNQVWKLNRSLYGLKQAPRQWNKKFTEFLKLQDLQVSAFDECILYKVSPLLIILIYVDDGIIFARNNNDIENLLKKLKDEFEINIIETNAFLGFEYTRPSLHKICIHQNGYIRRTLKRFDMENAKSVDTPRATSQCCSDDRPADEGPYRSMVGSLLYAAIISRPDIAYAVGKSSQKLSNPTQMDYVNVKRIMRYLNQKEDMCLTYSSTQNKEIIGYCDADFAGDIETSKSTTGFIFFLGNGPIMWKSQRQGLVTTSTSESESISLCTATKEALGLKNLATELGIIDDKPVKIYCDNQNAIELANGKRSIHRTRHIGAQINFTREQVDKKQVEIKYVPTEQQKADIFTKALSGPKFITNRNWFMTRLMLISALSIITNTTEATYFEQVKPLVWLPTENFVETGIIEQEVLYVYQNPCHMIEESNSGTVKSTVLTDLKSRCNKFYLQHWQKIVNELSSIHTEAPKTRQKRELVTLALLGITTVIISNLVRTEMVAKEVTDLTYKLNKAEQLIRNLQSVQQEQEKLNTATIQELKTLAEQQHIQGQAINELTGLMPYVSWISAGIVNAISDATHDLTTIIQEFTNGRVATHEMARLLNISSIAKYRAHETEFESITQESEASLRFRFTFKIKSLDTFVYRAGAFNYIEDLTSEPTLVEYQGSEYLIYNKTNNCVKAIDSPHQTAVIEECSEKNREDNRLKLWKKTKIDIDDMRNRPEPKVQRSIKNNYIYCYRHSIVIDGETTLCPPYVFKLAATKNFETEGIRHSAMNRTINARLETSAIDNVQTNHFMNDSSFTYEMKLIDSMRSINMKIQEITSRHEIARDKSESLMYILGGVLAVSILIISTLTCVLLKNCRPRSQPENHTVYRAPSKAPPLPPYDAVNTV